MRLVETDDPWTPLPELADGEVLVVVSLTELGWLGEPSRGQEP